MGNVLINFSFSFRFISICSLKIALSGGLSCVHTFSKVDVSVSIFCSVVVDDMCCLDYL